MNWYTNSCVITQKWHFHMKSDWNTLSDAFKTNYVFRISSYRLQFISSYLFLLNSWIDTQIVVLLHKKMTFSYSIELEYILNAVKTNYVVSIGYTATAGLRG